MDKSAVLNFLFTNYGPQHMAEKHMGVPCVPRNVYLHCVCEAKKCFFHHSKQHMGFTLQQVCSRALETAVESFSSLTASSLYGKYKLDIFHVIFSLQTLVCSNF